MPTSPVSPRRSCPRRRDTRDGTTVQLVARRSSGSVRVYEQVLREGTDFDVRYFIDVDELLDLSDDLVLPVHVRRAWADWYRERRGVDLAC